MATQEGGQTQAGKAHEEVESYKRFTLTVAERVAEAHEEGGEATSAAEREAIQKITATLG